MKENVQNETEHIVSYQHKSFRTSINESWNRCIQYQLTNQDKPRILQVSSERIERLLKEHKDILEIGHPYIKSLSSVMMKKGAVIGLSNKEGIILHIEGKAAELKQLGYQRGYVHSESYMGTNAIGACIETGRPIIVWGEEHFLEYLRGWVGFAAPIYISQDYLEAVLFAIIPVKEAHRGTMAIISIGANSIGKQLQLTNDKQKLLSVQEMMQEARNNIMEASSIISHEVRNSLTNISAYIQLLQLDKSINNIRGDKILKEIARVNRLLDDFKILSRHQQENVFEQSLNETLQFVIDVMRPKAELNNVDIIYAPYKKDVNIEADKNSLHHVFINLIDNAIQAMGDGGILSINYEIDTETDEVILSFKDTGPGIPPDQIHQIFKIFHTTKKNGSGLGLHICQTIIKFHGGNIEVESVEGEGATFFVRLPIARR